MSKASESIKKWRNYTKQRMIDAMGGKCQCCGYNTCNRSLAFHHVDPLQKDMGFDDLRLNTNGWKFIIIELKKCVLVCHNCHGEIHSGIREIPLEYDKFNDSYEEYKAQPDLEKCSQCGNVKRDSTKYCSRSCAAKVSGKVDWENIDLLELLNTYTVAELVDKLGISDGAIYKRRKKLLNLL